MILNFQKKKFLGFDKYMELRKAKMLIFKMSNIHELFDDDDEENKISCKIVFIY